MEGLLQTIYFSPSYLVNVEMLRSLSLFIDVPFWLFYVYHR